jgi:hypothetical protein
MLFNVVMEPFGLSISLSSEGVLENKIPRESCGMIKNSIIATWFKIVVLRDLTRSNQQFDIFNLRVNIGYMVTVLSTCKSIYLFSSRK